MCSSAVRWQILPAAAALGLSTTAFFGYLCLLNSPTHLVLYHIDQSASAVFLPVIIDTLLLAALCLVAFIAAQHRARFHRILWSLIISIFPVLALKSIAMAAGIGLPFALKLAMAAFPVLTAFVLLLLCSPAVDRAFHKSQSFTETLLAAIGIVGVIFLLQATWFAVQASHLNDQRVANTIRARIADRPHQRIVWIVFDELAYRQLYGQRLPGLALPAFDQFRAESTVFSDVQPAGISTDIVLPALMTGHPVDQIRASPQGWLLMHNQTGWRPFNQRDTVFADADSLGYVTSVVGWYNPYCRLLPAVLNSCFWTNHSGRLGLFPDQTFLQTVLGLITNFARQANIFSRDQRRSPAELRNAGDHIHDFTVLDKAADAALDNPNETFVFLHMPVPHPNGIWDRGTGRFAADHSSYVDNLALADLYLAHVRQLLTSDGQWDNTTIVIEGDHGWRTRLLWLNSPAWSSEDTAASDGGSFDPRPALIVKLPNQHTTAQIDTAFDATRTRPLLDELLERRITNPNQLEHWACCETPGASAMQPAHGHFSPPT